MNSDIFSITLIAAFDYSANRCEAGNPAYQMATTKMGSGRITFQEHFLSIKLFHSEHLAIVTPSSTSLLPDSRIYCHNVFDSHGDFQQDNVPPPDWNLLGSAGLRIWSRVSIPPPSFTWSQPNPVLMGRGWGGGMSRVVQSSELSPSSPRKLKVAILLSWAIISPKLFQKLIEEYLLS